MTTAETVDAKQQLEAQIRDLDEKIRDLRARIEDLPVRREEAERLDLAELAAHHRQWVADGSPAYRRPGLRHNNLRDLERRVLDEDRQLRTLQAEREEALAQLYSLRRAEYSLGDLQGKRQQRNALKAEMDQLQAEHDALDGELHRIERQMNSLYRTEWEHRHAATNLRQGLEASRR